ncbi:hypothetical protein GSH05_03350 [Burkholderia pseudomallei]|uniref:Uncharacterized protein n=4 Tax=pseudomallei group TaxID=111527 RepID=A0AAX1X602_BURML|nr:hypothetical protein BMA1661 [Burkholderia mallei ATCC 23344]ARK99461.1 hypothetical protein BOC43_36240 [Burkholderia pseudomallei]RKO02539.1 hypothetical protein D8O31_02565 [Burkholderia mallei]AUL54791.1 hypothetical protein BHT10_01810 [Burkholderia pseudomallei]MBM5615570.1 hypothetical protein [Burkholderia pseudomallei]
MWIGLSMVARCPRPVPSEAQPPPPVDCTGVGRIGRILCPFRRRIERRHERVLRCAGWVRWVGATVVARLA